MTPDKPWFAEGLQFTCTRCGNCCQSSDPEAELQIRYTLEERQSMASYLRVSLAEFNAKYARLVSGGMSLRSKPREGGGKACVFLNSDNSCAVYDARPIQCRTWPFWPENVSTPDKWAEAKASDDGCPGMGQGELIPVSAILQRVYAQAKHDVDTGIANL